MNERLGYRCFVRPNTNDKVFPGGVVQYHTFGGYLQQCDQAALHDDLLCLLARPEAIADEYRLVIADGKVITASSYRVADRLITAEGCPDGAVALAEAAAKVWSPHRIFVMDIARQNVGSTGRVQNPRYAVIECGSINTAGLYACNLEKVVEAMSRIAMEEWAQQEGVA